MQHRFAIEANWPAPAHIGAITTTRCIGLSQPPFDKNNLGLHVQDDPQAVLANRAQLRHQLDLTDEPLWLEQTHSTRCIVAGTTTDRQADAAVSRDQHYPLVIMTADCLPILLCNRQGTEIAAIHAGWRGLLNGIIENTIQKLNTPPADMMAWVGPAICPECFEVGQEVQDAYTARYAKSDSCFTIKKERLTANLPQLAEMVLNHQGIHAVYHAHQCTVENKALFYSYRRESQTGRIATLIWFRSLE